MVLLWLALLCKVPFGLENARTKDGTSILAELVDYASSFLSRPGKESEAGAFLLDSLLRRWSDMLINSRNPG